MGAWGMHLDFAPDIAGGALFPYLESMANQKFGMVIGKNGGDTIIAAMVRALEAAGGEVRLGAEAVRVLTASGGASVVELADGQRIEASRAIIANLNPRVLSRLLAPPPPAHAQMARLRPGPGTMMVHLALSDLPDWAAGPALKSFAYVHLAPSFAAMAKAYTEALAGMLPVEPVLVVGQPTAIDPGRAPPGKHVLWVQVRVLPAKIDGDAAGRIAATNWNSAKEAYADRVVDLIERYAPGFRAKVLARTVLSPTTLSATIPISSAATVFPAATTSTRTSCSGPHSAFRDTERRFHASTWSAPRPGRVPEPARAPVSCWRRSWPARDGHAPASETIV